MFSRIGRDTTLKNKVVNHITSLINSGTLAPGDRLPTEREMAEKFGVSRSVIRDAIKTLSGTGLIEVRRGVGIFITEVDSNSIARDLSGLLVNDIDTIELLFEVRTVLEIAAARCAAERCSAEGRQRVKMLIKDSCNLLTSDLNLDYYKENDRKVHLLVAELSSNALMLSLMSNMLNLLEVSRSLTANTPERAKLSVKEHIKLLKAIYHHQVDQAGSLMQAHLISVLNYIKEVNYLHESAAIAAR